MNELKKFIKVKLKVRNKGIYIYIYIYIYILVYIYIGIYIYIYIYENCALLGYYVASSGKSLPTFRDKLWVL